MLFNNITLEELNNIRTLLCIKYAGIFNNFVVLPGRDTIAFACRNNDQIAGSYYIITNKGNLKEAWEFALADNLYFESME